MRVLVTGATGFIGSHTVFALAEAGHTVRAFVRDEMRARRMLGDQLAGTEAGDITDAVAVGKALDGCDAVVHTAAAVVTTTRMSGVLEDVNRRGTELVVGAARDRGLDPIVHTSSMAALFDPSRVRMAPDDPVATGSGPYAASKAAAERHLRHLQDEGAAVTVVYPHMVLGPFSAERGGEASEAVQKVARAGAVPIVSGGWSIVDVRDVAAVLTASVESGRGPRRYLASGTYCTMAEVADLFDEATGRTLRRLRSPDRLMLAWGRASELAQRAFRYESAISREGMQYLLRAPHGDDSRTRDELGISFRPPIESVRATLAGLVASGRLSARHAGEAARQ